MSGEHPVFALRWPSPCAGHQSSPARQPSSRHLRQTVLQGAV